MITDYSPFIGFKNASNIGIKKKKTANKQPFQSCKWFHSIQIVQIKINSRLQGCKRLRNVKNYSRDTCEVSLQCDVEHEQPTCTWLWMVSPPCCNLPNNTCNLSCFAGCVQHSRAVPTNSDSPKELHILSTGNENLLWFRDHLRHRPNHLLILVLPVHETKDNTIRDENKVMNDGSRFDD